MSEYEISHCARLAGKSAEIWKRLPTEREMVIASNRRTIAIPAAINEANPEESLAAFRQARSVEAVTEPQAAVFEEGDGQNFDVRNRR